VHCVFSRASGAAFLLTDSTVPESFYFSASLTSPPEENEPTLAFADKKLLTVLFAACRGLLGELIRLVSTTDLKKRRAH
jgi:hypothetical protein